jgi:hypothetical protein
VRFLLCSCKFVEKEDYSAAPADGTDPRDSFIDDGTLVELNQSVKGG